MTGALRKLHQKRHRWFSFLAFVVAMVASGAAYSEEARRPIAEAIELGPSRCLKKSSLARSVSAWLGRDDIERALTISVADAPDGVRFEVRRGDAVIGERTLTVDRLPCADVRAAVGLGIASAIDITILDSLGLTKFSNNAEAPVDPTPVATTAPPIAPSPLLVPQPSPSPPRPLNPWAPIPPPLISPPPPERPWPTLPLSPGLTLSPGFGPYGNGPPSDTRFPREPTRARRSIPTWSVNAELGVLIGVLPKVALGVAPSFEVTVLRWLDLRAGLFATSRIETGLEDSAGNVRALGSTGLVSGRLDACAALELGSVTRLRGCAGMLAGAAYASGSSVANPRSSGGAWVSPAIRGDLRWSLTRIFGLALSVDGFAPLLKPRLRILDPSARTVATKAFPAAGLGISLGPSLAF